MNDNVLNNTCVICGNQIQGMLSCESIGEVGMCCFGHFKFVEGFLNRIIPTIQIPGIGGLRHPFKGEFSDLGN